MRLVSIGDETFNEVVTTGKALEMALQREMDLVEIAPQAVPPVVKILDYAKFAYDLRKQRKIQKANQQQTTMKELRFGPNTDEHDIEFKLKHAEKFLSEGNKLKTYVQFRGRNIVYKERGLDILGRVAERLDNLAKIEMAPHMEGRRMIMIMTPK
ncbi:MAG: translation initiation factor IF-3 [Bacteroidia bacterium]